MAIIIKCSQIKVWTEQVVHVRPVEDGEAGIYYGCNKGNYTLTFPSTASKSVGLFNAVELKLWDERVLPTVRSRSASGVVTVLARPSTVAFSS